MHNFTFYAIYKNGTRLDLESNPYDKLDRTQIKEMEVMKDGEPFFLMQLDEGVKLIYRRRVEKSLTQDGEFVVYLLGWHKDGIQSINYISQDGRVIQGGKWNDNDAWQYAPKLREFEL